MKVPSNLDGVRMRFTVQVFLLVLTFLRPSDSSLWKQQQQQLGNSTGSRPRVCVSFINGIYHSKTDWNRITDSLSLLFGCEVHAFYNPSSGNWISDASKAGYLLLRRPSDASAAGDLATHFRTMLAEMGPRDRILHLAHSGGAIVTYLAAKHHLSQEETDRIDVSTFGGGRSITRKYFKGRIVNYYARNDPVLFVDKRASDLMRLTENITFSEVTYSKHNTSFVFVEGRSRNPILDHSMEGVTYGLALELEAAQRIRREYLMFYEDSIAPSAWVRRVRKYAANITGRHHFWSHAREQSNSTHAQTITLFRRMRKYFAQISGMRGFYSGKYSTLLKEQIALATG